MYGCNPDALRDGGRHTVVKKFTIGPCDRHNHIVGGCAEVSYQHCLREDEAGRASEEIDIKICERVLYNSVFARRRLPTEPFSAAAVRRDFNASDLAGVLEYRHHNAAANDPSVCVLIPASHAVEFEGLTCQ